MSFSFGDKKSDNCKEHGEFTATYIFGRWTMCQQCAELRVVELDKKREQEAIEIKKEKSLASAQIPIKLNGAMVKNYESVSTAQDRVIACVKDYVGRLSENIHTAGNLMLVGKTGTGKTHLGCAILRSMANSMYRVRYVKSSDMIQQFFESWGDKSMSQKEIITHYASYDLLMIDEVGLNDVDNDKGQAYLYKIIDARNGENKPTIITSNMFDHELPQAIGDRTFDRLCENGLILRFVWESYRQRSRRVV